MYFALTTTFVNGDVEKQCRQGLLKGESILILKTQAKANQPYNLSALPFSAIGFVLPVPFSAYIFFSSHPTGGLERLFSRVFKQPPRLRCAPGQGSWTADFNRARGPSSGRRGRPSRKRRGKRPHAARGAVDEVVAFVLLLFFLGGGQFVFRLFWTTVLTHSFGRSIFRRGPTKLAIQTVSCSSLQFSINQLVSCKFLKLENNIPHPNHTHRLKIPLAASVSTKAGYDQPPQGKHKFPM